MGYLEIQFYENCKNELSVKDEKYIKENWYKFLDECYIAFDASNINPLKLFNILYNILDILNNILLLIYLIYLITFNIMHLIYFNIIYYNKLYTI